MLSGTIPSTISRLTNLEVIDFHSNYLTTINDTKLERSYFPPAATNIDLSDNCLSFDGPPVATPTHCQPTATPTVAPSAPTEEATSTPTTTPTDAPTAMTPSALPTMGSLQDDIDKEGQACAAMAAALPQLQTYAGRNHCKSINIISEQYHSSSSSYERIPTFS